MTRRFSCRRYGKLFRLPGVAACFLPLLLIPALTNALDLKQMHQVEGIEMIDADIRTVFDTYGLPVMIASRGKSAKETRTTATWGQTRMDLQKGDWNVIYSPRETSPVYPGQMWTNPHPAVSARFSRLVLNVRGNVGHMTVRRHPLKTTYDVPRDPLLSHKVIGVKVGYKTPIQVSDVIARYGDKYDSVKDGPSDRRIRYWVLREDGKVPTGLYAVDFLLNEKSDSVVGAEVSDSDVDFVHEKFQVYFEQWERSLYD